MAGRGIRLYTDEMIDPALALALRERGYDVQSCHELGQANRSLSDATQLHFATEQGRAILTFNVGDFVTLDLEWKAAGRDHADILASSRVTDLGELLRRVQHHLDDVLPNTQLNTLLWLSSVPTR
jgi:hypothetical protein